MPNLTRAIEKYIHDLLESEEAPSVSLRRKELAASFGCVPSQINYVLRSRFTPERGFLVESQRGGHGYIRILRIAFEEPEEKLNHIEDIVGDSISSSGPPGARSAHRAGAAAHRGGPETFRRDGAERL